MRKNAFLKVFVALGLLVVAGGTVRADIASDSRQSAHWFSREIGRLMVFQAASTHFLPGDTVKFPGFELGVAGNVSVRRLDVKGFRGLSFDTLDNKNQFDLPSAIGAPAGLFHVKAGLPWGVDVGLKAGSAQLNKTDGAAKTDFHNKIFGLEFRKSLLGGLAAPDLSLSLGFDRATGDLTRTDRYNGAITGGTLNADTAWRTDWNVRAATLRAVVSKKLLVVTPFAGLGVTKESGDSTTRVQITGTQTPGGAVNVNTLGGENISKSYGHFLAGIEFTPLPFLRLNLGGLVAKDAWSASLGIRAQFP